MKIEVSRKSKPSISPSIIVPTLTGLSRASGSEQKNETVDTNYPPAGGGLRDRVGSLDIRRELRVEPLLLCIKRRQLRWVGHLIGMPPRHPFRHDRLERPDVSLQNLLG